MFNVKWLILCRRAFLKHSWIPMVVVSGFLFTACREEGGVDTVSLPVTGQATCYDQAGGEITCTGTGQDGDAKAGVAWPTPRFVVGTGATADCVTDNLTGLMWVGAPSAVPDTWANALTSANGLTLCGFSDWRLPNRKELRSLVNYGLANNAIALNALGFSSVQADFYWSSSSYVNSADNAWVVYMYDGRVVPSGKYISFYVWPVRAGQ
jgi:hypothetical protein